VGMWGGNDPDCRKPMIWDDINYDDEVYNADGTKHAPDKVAVNENLFQHYKKLITIRKNNEVLQLGTYKAIFTDDEKGILIFERTYNDQNIIVVINNSDSVYVVNVPELKQDCFKDLISEKLFEKDDIIVDKKWG